MFSERLAKGEKVFLAVLFVVALALRFAYLIENSHTPFFDHPRLDALFHDTWAKTIAAGNILGEEVFFRAPFYPYFLSLQYAIFGHTYAAPRVVQHILGAATVILVYVFTRKIFGKSTALVASILTSLYPVLIYFEGELLFESILTFLLMAWAILFTIAIESRSFRHWLTAGIAYGVICLTRPTFLAIIIPVLAYIIFLYYDRRAWKRSLQLISSFAAGAILLILPVTIRNYLVGDDWVLVATQGGINFYIGNNNEADGHSSSMPASLGPYWENSEQTAYVERSIGHKPTPSEESDFWYAKGFAFIYNEPADALMLYAKKAYLFWNKTEIPNNQSFYSFQQYSLVLQYLPIGFWLVGPLALLGMIFGWRNIDARAVVVFVSTYFLVTIAFFVCDRYKVPLVPVLCAFAAFSLTNIWRTLRERNLVRLAKLTVPLAAFIWFVNSNYFPVLQKNPAQDYLRLAMVAVDQKNYDQAIEFCNQASAQRTAIPNLDLTRGVAEWLRGNSSAAKAAFRQELQHNVSSYATLCNLAAIYLNGHQTDSAVAFGLEAIRVKPRVPAAYTLAATGFSMLNNTQAAESLLHVGRKLCDRGFEYGEYMLGEIELARDQFADAESRFRLVLNHSLEPLQPRYESEFGYSESAKSGEDSRTILSKAADGLARIFVAHRQLDSAIVYFHTSTRFDSSNANAWQNLGLALMQTRDFAGAEMALSKSVQLTNSNYLYWYNLGTLFGRRGRFAEARHAFEESLRLKPDFIPARESLALTRELSRK